MDLCDWLLWLLVVIFIIEIPNRYCVFSGRALICIPIATDQSFPCDITITSPLHCCRRRSSRHHYRSKPASANSTPSPSSSFGYHIAQFTIELLPLIKIDPLLWNGSIRCFGDRCCQASGHHHHAQGTWFRSKGRMTTTSKTHFGIRWLFATASYPDQCSGRHRYTERVRAQEMMMDCNSWPSSSPFRVVSEHRYIY